MLVPLKRHWYESGGDRVGGVSRSKDITPVKPPLVTERQGTGGTDGEIRLLAGGDKLILRLSRNDWGSVYRQHRIGAGYASGRIARDDIVATRVGELHRDPRVIGIGRTGNVGAVEAPLV